MKSSLYATQLMKSLNFPDYPIRFKEEEGKSYVFCHIRKRFMISGPEEIVRQHLIHFLIEERQVPRSLISLEKQLMVNKRRRRTDLLVYNREGQAVLLAECKAPEIAIKQEVFEQIARYNLALKVPFLLVTNGLNHYVCCINLADGSYSFLPDVPEFSALIRQ